MVMPQAYMYICWRVRDGRHFGHCFSRTGRTSLHAMKLGVQGTRTTDGCLGASLHTLHSCVGNAFDLERPDTNSQNQTFLKHIWWFLAVACDTRSTTQIWGFIHGILGAAIFLHMFFKTITFHFDGDCSLIWVRFMTQLILAIFGFSVFLHKQMSKGSGPPTVVITSH